MPSFTREVLHTSSDYSIFLIRFHEHDDAVIGQPYVASCVLRIDHAIHKATVKGLSGVFEIALSTLRPFGRLLLQEGVETVTWERYFDDQAASMTYELARHQTQN